MPNYRIAAVSVLLGICGIAQAQAVIHETHQLLADDPTPEDRYGWVVDIDGNLVVVGASYDDDGGRNTGSVFVYNAVTGALVQKLTSSDARPGDELGTRVAISGTTVVVGAPKDDDEGDRSGVVFVFDAITGAQLHKLLPSDGGEDHSFGSSVDLDGNLAVISASDHTPIGTTSGDVYLFDISTGTELRKFVPPASEFAERYGGGVISNGRVLVSVRQDTVDGDFVGTGAYLFDAATGDAIALLIPEEDGVRYGVSDMAISESYILLGVASYDGPAANQLNMGAVFVYDALTGAELGKLLANDGFRDDDFGAAVAISRDTAIISASGDSPQPSYYGAAYVFDVSTFTQTAKLYPENNAGFDNPFCSSVAIGDHEAVVGTRDYSTDTDEEVGTAHIFTIAPRNCPADLNGDGYTNNTDINLFVQAFLAMDAAGDFNDDGNWNNTDINLFVQAFLAGCS